jgi:tyrosyl-tRNA synthetase
MKSFIGELTWREMIHDITPDTDKILLEKSVSGYIGFDPTADSLHIGNLVQIIVLMHFQNYGNKPYILVGGATGMIGDPSGKSSERALLDKKSLDINLEKIKNQLSKFLKFNKKENSAVIVNNYEWMKKLSLIDFNRDIGKHITINYMMSKDSVKKRFSNESGEGMSFTEFSYQLIQGYDFLHLYKNYDCILQMGGSDQWGNITTGTELIRRKLGKKAFALTCKLLTKSDGSKFGKTASGNIWLDKEKTSPFKFYQYWLNLSDEDSEKFIKIFTFLPRAEIENLLVKHRNEKHKRILQKNSHMR